MEILLFLVITNNLDIDLYKSNNNSKITICWQVTMVNEPCNVVNIYYSENERDWIHLASFANINNENPWKHSFTWFVPEGRQQEVSGIIKIICKGNNEHVTKQLLLNNIQQDSYSNLDDEPNLSKKGYFNLDIAPSWPMFRYDAQHSGHYPCPLYPPGKKIWEKSCKIWEDFLMSSGSVGNGLLYFGLGDNVVNAIDIRAGAVIWRDSPANLVFTTTLANDTLLFVGVMWFFNPTTFYCIDARNGRILWSKEIKSVEYPPIVVDTFVIVATNVASQLYVFTLSGKLVWSDTIPDIFNQDFFIPTYYKGKVFFSYGNGELKALDLLTGTEVWEYRTFGGIDCTPTVYDGILYFIATFGTFYALDAETGKPIWIKPGFHWGNHDSPLIVDSLLFSTSGTPLRYHPDSLEHITFRTIIYCINRHTNEIIWYRLYDGGSASSLITTANDVIWFSNQYLYAIDGYNGNVMYKLGLKLFEEEPYSSTWFFPMVYDRYLIGTSYQKVYAVEFLEVVDSFSSSNIFALPNPFRLSTVCRFEVKMAGNIKVSVFDTEGRMIKELINKNIQPGVYFTGWDGNDTKGISCAKGIYFIVGDLNKRRSFSTKIVYLGKEKND
jgi:outer membrane protein assembly factor BamB